MKSLFRFLNVLPRSKEEKLAQLTCELVNANNEAEKLRDEKEKISKSFKKLSVSFIRCSPDKCWQDVLERGHRELLSNMFQNFFRMR